ncbi:MAG: hypothetical protein ACFFDF_04555 [Candidatus Odinarchaeota archaeon]
MLQEPFVFLGIYIISLILTNFLLSDRAGMLKPIALRLFFIGVIFHELAHYTMSLAVGRVPKSLNIMWRDKNHRYALNPQGRVEPDDNFSFLQAVVVAFAPLYFSTWLIFWFLFGVIFTPLYDPAIKTLSVFVVLSLLLTAAPSSGDILFIGTSFKQDPKNSWYQILLIGLSILVLWGILVITQVTFFLDVFYYLAIAGIYLFLRFFLIGIRKIVSRIYSYNFKRPQKVTSRPLTRKRYRPVKPGRQKKRGMR